MTDTTAIQEDAGRRAWHEILFSRKMIICILLGFSSGMPLFVLTHLVPAWLRTEEVDLATIGRAPKGEAYSDKAKAFLQANHDFTVRTLEEDFVLGEQIHRGLATGANTQLRFASFERALVELHEGLERQLSETG